MSYQICYASLTSNGLFLDLSSRLYWEGFLLNFKSSPKSKSIFVLAFVAINFDFLTLEVEKYQRSFSLPKLVLERVVMCSICSEIIFFCLSRQASLKRSVHQWWRRRMICIHNLYFSAFQPSRSPMFSFFPRSLLTITYATYDWGHSY